MKIEKKTDMYTKRFYPQPRKKLVAGKLEMKCSLWGEIEKKFPGWVSTMLWDFLISNKRLGDACNKTFVALAKCDKDDAYDEQTGIDIVDEKLNARYHREMASQYYKLCDILSDLVEKFQKFGDMHYTKYVNIDRDLYEYYIEGSRKNNV